MCKSTLATIVVHCAHIPASIWQTGEQVKGEKRNTENEITIYEYYV